MEFEVLYIYSLVAIQRQTVACCKLPGSRISRKTIATIQTTGSGLPAKAPRVRFCERATTDVAAAYKYQSPAIYRVDTRESTVRTKPGKGPVIAES